MSARVERDIKALAAGGEQIFVGPWLGEVGFELLYWIPFLQWAIDVAGLDRSRLLVVSRGGTASWYRHVSDRYADVFDYLTPEEYAARNRARHDEVGEQKQTRVTALERDIVDRIAASHHLASARLIHPETMYALFNPYWWGHRGAPWIEQHARFRPLEAVPAADLPADYAAVKFYFNECFPATTENQATAARIVRALAEDGPVISLATGLRVDDHHAWDEEAAMARHGMALPFTPATNLAAQTSIVAGARVWAGTYGGFAYLAPFHRVPAYAFFSNAGGYSPRHLALAQQVFARFGPGLLNLNHELPVARTLAPRPCSGHPEPESKGVVSRGEP